MPRGDGKLRIAFVAIGQGDCIVVACPNGKVALIDCGTNRWDNVTGKDVRFQLFTDNFLANYKVDVLILTHPDKDHYSALKQVLTQGDKQCVIDAVYFSGNLDRYLTNGVGAWLKLTAGIPPQNQIKFTLNQDTAEKNLVEVLDGGEDCGIYLLAGGVKWESARDGNSVDPRNPGSLITFITFAGSKILLCGDATQATEKFLMQHFEWAIKDVQILQVPHHGSETTSSHQAFVDKVNPQTAVICAATTSSHKLPRWEIINRYSNGRRLEALDEHPLACWHLKHLSENTAPSKQTMDERADEEQASKKRKDEQQQSKQPIKRRKIDPDQNLKDAEGKWENIAFSSRKDIQTTGSKGTIILELG